MIKDSFGDKAILKEIRIQIVPFIITMISIKKHRYESRDFRHPRFLTLNTRPTWYFILCTLYCMASLSAQTWRSTYYPVDWTPPSTKQNFYTDAFLQDYSYAGYARGEREIPDTVFGKIYDVSQAPYHADTTGQTDATIAIQKAIHDAEAHKGGTIYMPKGTYLVSAGLGDYALKISHSHIHIKGAGNDKTFIINTDYRMRSKQVIRVGRNNSWQQGSEKAVPLTADVMGPSKTISVAETSPFKIGDMVLLRNFISNEWIREHAETSWLDHGKKLEGLQYCRYITAVDSSNNTITIDIPLRYALKTRDGACVYKIDGMLTEVGLSGFSIGNKEHPSATGWSEEAYSLPETAAYDCHDSFLIAYCGVVNGWIKNIHSYQAHGNNSGAHFLSNGVLVSRCKNVTLSHCDFSHAQYGGGGGNGYAYRIESNEVLLKQCTASHCRHGFVFARMHSSGNVIHASKSIHTGVQCGHLVSSATLGKDSDHHMHLSQSNLIDQSYTENSAFVAYYRPYGNAPKHCLTATHSTFWNITSSGNRGFCIWTQQVRYGYAIGSSGSSSVILSKDNTSESANITHPLDIVEGEGTGNILEPQSLYLDQLKKRMKK